MEKMVGTSDVPSGFTRIKRHKKAELTAGTSDVPSGFTSAEQPKNTQKRQYRYLLEIPIARVRGYACRIRVLESVGLVYRV